MEIHEILNICMLNLNVLKSTALWVGLTSIVFSCSWFGMSSSRSPVAILWTSFMLSNTYATWLHARHWEPMASRTIAAPTCRNKIFKHIWWFINSVFPQQADHRQGEGTYAQNTCGCIKNAKSRGFTKQNASVKSIKGMSFSCTHQCALQNSHLGRRPKKKKLK